MIHEKIAAQFRLWNESHPFTECGGKLKVKFIREQLAPAFEACEETMLPGIKLEKCISYQMRVARKMVIRPSHTKNGYTQPEFGEENVDSRSRAQLHNTKNNPINNPMNSAKTKEAYRTTALAYLAEIAPETFEQILSAEQIETEVERIVLDTQIFNGLSHKMLTDDPKSKSTFDIGETKRLTEDEDLRFLTARGRHSKRIVSMKVVKVPKKNRPVLLEASQIQNEIQLIDEL
jgi:hypothetical protein